MPRRAKTKDRYAVGSPITFMLGAAEWHGVILEDRGPIGSGGRRMLRVSADVEASDPMVFEIAAENVQVAA